MSYQSTAGTDSTDPSVGVTHAHTQLAGSDRVVGVSVHWETEGNEASSIASASYGGTSILANATPRATGTAGSGNATYAQNIYALEALMAALGDGVRNVVVTLASGGARQGLRAQATQFSGRAQTVPTGSATAQADGASVSITAPAADSDILLAWSNNTSGTTTSAGGSFTTRWDTGGFGDTRSGGATLVGISGAQTCAFSPGGSRPATTADAIGPAGGGNIDLVVADVAQAQALDNVALTQANTLVVADLAQAQALDAVALTQQNALAVGDIAQAQSLDAVSLTQQNVLAVADASQAQALDAVVLTQANALALADIAQAQALDAVALTQANVLAVADALQAQGLEGVVLVQQNTLAVAGVQQDQALDAVVLSLATILAVADSLQSQSLETVALVQGYVLAVQDALQAQSLGGAALTQAYLLVVADLHQVQSLTGITLHFPGEGQQPFETEAADARSLSHTAGSRSHNWTAPRRQN